MTGDTANLPIGFTFRETMQGFVSEGEDYGAAHAAGRGAGSRLRFHVTVTIPDFRAFLRDEHHETQMTGTVDSLALGSGLAIEGGLFNLFARDERGHRVMRYRLPFTSAAGEPCLLEGYKDVHNDRTFDFWYDTTALFTTLHAGDGPVSRGILRIRAIDLVPQVLSMRALNTRNPARHALVLGRFGLFFAGHMLDEYRPRLRPGRRNGSTP